MLSNILNYLFQHSSNKIKNDREAEKEVAAQIKAYKKAQDLLYNQQQLRILEKMDTSGFTNHQLQIYKMSIDYLKEQLK